MQGARECVFSSRSPLAALPLNNFHAPAVNLLLQLQIIHHFLNHSICLILLKLQNHALLSASSLGHCDKNSDRLSPPPFYVNRYIVLCLFLKLMCPCVSIFLWNTCTWRACLSAQLDLFAQRDWRLSWWLTETLCLVCCRVLSCHLLQRLTLPHCWPRTSQSDHWYFSLAIADHSASVDSCRTLPLYCTVFCTTR